MQHKMQKSPTIIREAISDECSIVVDGLDGMGLGVVTRYLPVCPNHHIALQYMEYMADAVEI